MRRGYYEQDRTEVQCFTSNCQSGVIDLGELLAPYDWQFDQPVLQENLTTECIRGLKHSPHPRVILDRIEIRV